jgi:hypothetical protein
MPYGQEHARLHAEELREELALGKEERRLEREEREMELEMSHLEDDEERVERQIEEEWRRERGGHEPERPPAWPHPSVRSRDAKKRRS